MTEAIPSRGADGSQVPPSKLTLAVDFHGVICSYRSGNGGPRVSDDPPTEGAFAFLESAAERFRIAVVCARFGRRGTEGIWAMRSALAWFRRHKFRLPITVEPDRRGPVYLTWLKPPCHVLIDDRAIRFEGTWPDPAELESFKPWNR